APGVSGVGFIAFDEVNARYLGALALAVGDVSISAVGVLDTRLPGGAQGYSLVVVASATFPPIQLGFGFSLGGSGGAGGGGWGGGGAWAGGERAGEGGGGAVG